MYKKLIVSLALLILFEASFSQTIQAKDSVRIHIKNLSWSSFQLTPTYFHQLVLNKDAQAIINNAGDKTMIAEKLLEEIEKEEKTVVVHVILSQLLERKELKFSENYTYSADSIVAVRYSYNNLS